MIQANELRIGNWVKFINKTFKVCGGTIEDCQKANNTDSPYQYEPIKLTEEILLKCGFEWVKELGGYGDKHHFVDEWKVDNDHYFLFQPFCTTDLDCYIKIYSLHQLQNLYYCLHNKELQCSI